MKLSARLVTAIALSTLFFSVALQAKEKEKKARAETAIDSEKYDDIALFGRVINFVEKQYVDPVKTRNLVYGAIRGMLETLDPHSNFMPPDVYKQLKSDTSGKFGGLGLEVSVTKDNALTVIAPTEDTPAWKAGIKPGDKIIKIDGESTKSMSLVEAMSRIRGEAGSTATFTIQRDNVAKPLEFKLKRVNIDIKSVKYELLRDGYGWLKLHHFQEKTSNEVKDAIKKMEKDNKLKGLVLDLRNNPGGLLDEAANVVNLFVDSGVIVSTIGRDKESKEVKTAKSGIARTDIPLVVLVNSNSASAAEIVAGAIKDHKRGVIMGTRTFGKGSVQTVIPLADDVGLKLTIARYYTPNGTSIQAKGIEPDVELEDIDAETFEKIRTANKSIREADLRHHFDNEDDDSDETPPKTKAATDAAAKKASEKAMEAPKPLDPKTDYQVQQALNYLLGIDLMRGAVTAPPVSSKTP